MAGLKIGRRAGSEKDIRIQNAIPRTLLRANKKEAVAGPGYAFFVGNYRVFPIVSEQAQARL
jgi:hypothetical protein